MEVIAVPREYARDSNRSLRLPIGTSRLSSSLARQGMVERGDRGPFICTPHMSVACDDSSRKDRCLESIWEKGFSLSKGEGAVACSISPFSNLLA